MYPNFNQGNQNPGYPPTTGYDPGNMNTNYNMPPTGPAAPGIGFNVNTTTQGYPPGNASMPYGGQQGYSQAPGGYPSGGPGMGCDAGMGGGPGAGYGPGMGGAPGAGYGPGMGGAPGAGYGPGMGGAPGAGYGPGVGGAPGAGYGPGVGGGPGAGYGPAMGGAPGAGYGPGMGGAPGAGYGPAMGGAPGMGGGSGMASAPGMGYPQSNQMAGHGGYQKNVNIETIGSHGERYMGTIKPAPNFNAEHDSNILRKAMKGLGTDEKSIIECLGRRTSEQRLEIKKTFKTMFGKDLLDELKGELSGNFCRAVIESLYEPDYFDAHSLHKAMEGLGTRENILTEILTSRSNQQILAIRELYHKWFKRDLEKDVKSETSGFYKRVLVSCLQANKTELTQQQINALQTQGPNAIIDHNLASREAQELYNAGEKKLGTDESCFIRIFALRNRYQLRATFDAYEKISGRNILTSIEREMSGDLASSLKAMALLAMNPPLYFATRLHKAMSGAGTNDGDLIRLILTRSEIDMQNIKTEFQNNYGKTLESFVKGDTSGDYGKFLLRFVQGN